MSFWCKITQPFMCRFICTAASIIHHVLTDCPACTLIDRLTLSANAVTDLNLGHGVRVPPQKSVGGGDRQMKSTPLHLPETDLCKVSFLPWMMDGWSGMVYMCLMSRFQLPNWDQKEQESPEHLLGPFFRDSKFLFRKLWVMCFMLVIMMEPKEDALVSLICISSA